MGSPALLGIAKERGLRHHPMLVVNDSEPNETPSSSEDCQIRVFVCYAHEDKKWTRDGRHGLIPFIQARLRRDGVQFWWDREDEGGLHGGDEWRQKIFAEIDRADIAIPLISGSFAASEFIMAEELPRIRGRYDGQELSILPILVAPIGRKTSEALQWIMGLQMVPSERRSLEECSATDATWEKVKEDLLDDIDRRINQCRKTREAGRVRKRAAEEARRKKEEIVRVAAERSRRAGEQSQAQDKVQGACLDPKEQQPPAGGIRIEQQVEINASAQDPDAPEKPYPVGGPIRDVEEDRRKAGPASRGTGTSGKAQVDPLHSPFNALYRPSTIKILLSGILLLVLLFIFFVLHRLPQSPAIVTTGAASPLLPGPSPALATPSVAASPRPDDATTGENTYRGHVGPFDATFIIRFDAQGHVTGSYSMDTNRSKGYALRLDGENRLGKLLLNEYTKILATGEEHLSAKIDLKLKKTDSEISWEGTMHNIRSDNNIYPVKFTRLRQRATN